MYEFLSICSAFTKSNTEHVWTEIEWIVDVFVFHSVLLRQWWHFRWRLLFEIRSSIVHFQFFVWIVFLTTTQHKKWLTPNDCHYYLFASFPEYLCESSEQTKLMAIQCEENSGWYRIMLIFITREYLCIFIWLIRFVSPFLSSFICWFFLFCFWLRKKKPANL